jgi:two-component system, NtrC family, nitrogen regulation sensor histidine kinase NtrY
MASSRFAAGIAMRATVIGGLAFVLFELLATSRLYATALLVSAVAVFVILDLARYARRLDRMLGRFVDSVRVGEFQLAAPGSAGTWNFPTTAVALGRAVDALNQSREERQRELEYLRTLLDNVTAELLVIDASGAVGFANRAAQRFAGRTVGHVREITALGEEAAGRLMMLPPGERTVIRLRNGQRALASAALFASGGTRRKLISLQGIETELDMAEIAAWQNLSRILAHEMMNSLTPVVSLAGSIQPAIRNLLSHPGCNSIGTSLKEIETAIDAIERRSSGLMRFVERYRKVADLPQPAVRPTQLTEVVGRIDQLIAATIAQRGIAFSSLVVPNDLTVLADPDLLEQALINLIQNAIDAVEGSKEPKIDVHCASSDLRVTIAICDNGSGLEAAMVDQIFVPFFSTKPRGSGIGLALARQIALAHHGAIEVKARDGAGAIFTLVIPAP